jgi:putative ABC transport system permease protein
MIAPRWRKVARDIAQTPMRSLLAVLAMTAGIFGVGTILTSYALLDRELAATWDRTRPAAAILHLDSADEEILRIARANDAVAAAELRPLIVARLRVGKDEWAPVVLFVVRDFDRLLLDRFFTNSGVWPPGAEDVLLERSSLPVARASRGDRLLIRTPQGLERALHFAGDVHAPGLAPGWMDHVVAGFVPWNSIARSAGAERAQLRIAVTGPLTEKTIRRGAETLAGELRRAGYAVSRVEVPPVGRHPHADQMDTFLFLLGVFGALTLVLSGLLVANMIHALMAEQVRQVGIMKTVGGSGQQIVALYLGQVVILATIALTIGIPLGAIAGRAYGRFSASILNASLENQSVPLWVFLTVVAIGLGVPLLIAVGPVRRASRITIHEAFSGAAGERPFGTRALDRWMTRVSWLPRPLMLSFRTALRRRGRLLLTVVTLAAGGAVFLAALNSWEAWTRLLDADADARRYDVVVRFADEQPETTVAAAMRGVAGVSRFESWPDSTMLLPGYPDARIAVIGTVPSTPLLNLRILEGRWLRPDDGTAVVINQNLRAAVPALRVGGPIQLRSGNRDQSWTIVGVAEELGPHLGAYAPVDSFRAATGLGAGKVRTLRVVTSGHTPAAQRAAARRLERSFQAANIPVAQIQSLADNRKAVADHLVIIRSALLFASALVLLVGGFGLTSTLTLNVAGRTREIGVLTAIGAPSRTIWGNIVAEGLVVGLLSWITAIAFAVPVTIFTGRISGRIFHKAGLDFVMSSSALLIWLTLVIVLSAISSFYPAWKAARMTVREALSYE